MVPGRFSGRGPRDSVCRVGPEAPPGALPRPSAGRGQRCLADGYELTVLFWHCQGKSSRGRAFKRKKIRGPSDGDWGYRVRCPGLPPAAPFTRPPGVVCEQVARCLGWFTGTGGSRRIASHETRIRTPLATAGCRGVYTAWPSRLGDHWGKPPVEEPRNRL